MRRVRVPSQAPLCQTADMKKNLAEEQGFLDPQPPKYVQGRKKKNTVKGMEEGVNLPPVPALKADTTTRRDLN